MINHHIHVALGHERASTFLAEAQAGRHTSRTTRTRRARPTRPRAQPGPEGTTTTRAIGALSPADGRGVGIARYIRDPGDPEAIVPQPG